jgi:predicted phage replisome organizer
MAEIKWIKIVTDIFDDEKILLIESLPEADSIIVIWFKLLCLAGKQNNSGVFVMSNGIPYTDTMLATIFRRKEATVKLALSTFEKFGMVRIINDTVTIPNWSKHQNFDKIEARNEYMRAYMARYREKQKALASGGANSKDNSKDNSKVNVSVLDKIREDKIREDKNYIKRFVPPSLEEVTAYCRERHNDVNPQKWHDFYSAKGWMVGKNKMKDWKAAIRTWEKPKEKAFIYNDGDTEGSL